MKSLERLGANTYTLPLSWAKYELIHTGGSAQLATIHHKSTTKTTSACGLTARLAHSPYASKQLNTQRRNSKEEAILSNNCSDVFFILSTNFISS